MKYDRLHKHKFFAEIKLILNVIAIFQDILSAAVEFWENAKLQFRF